MQAKNVLERLNRNEQALKNASSWEEIMNATKVSPEEISNFAKSMGYSTFKDLQSASPGQMYNQDSTNVLKMFNRSITKSQVDIDSIKKAFEKVQSEYLNSTPNESRKQTANRALNVLEKLNNTEAIASAPTKDLAIKIGKQTDDKLKKLGSVEQAIKKYVNSEYSNDSILLKISKAVKDIETAVDEIERYK